MKLIAKLIEPKNSTGKSDRFTKSALGKLIVPLLIENALQLIVGLIDTLMVSYAGEATVSGVSLVSLLYTVFIYIFTAIASGGAVVAAQYLGSKEYKKVHLSASQTLHISLITSLILTALSLLFSEKLLHLLYPSVENDVMSAAKLYFTIVTLSFPALAVYNTGAAMCRTMGKTNITMRVSIIMNLINVIGNALGIFVFKAGAAGVAWPTTISWYFAAIAMTVYCARPKEQIHYVFKDVILPDWASIRTILKVAVPGGIENGLFQLAKVILGTITARFGTSQIAANGIGQTIWNVSAITVLAMPSAYITVVGQATGGGDMDEAEYYLRKLTRISYLIAIIANTLVIASLPLFIRLYDITDYTARLVIIITIIHDIFAALVQPLSSAMASGMRAAGDVKYAMYTSIFSTVICRVAFSYLLGIGFGLGVIGITLAMVIDWSIKACFVYVRLKNRKWRNFRVI